MDFSIFKEKIERISIIIKLAKWIIGLLILLNIFGIIYNKIDFTIILSLIIIILLWLWTLDAQLSKINNKMEKMEEKNEEKK